MTISLNQQIAFVIGVVFLASGVSQAQDKITFKDGRTQQGKVAGFNGTQLAVEIGSGTVNFPITTIDKIEMKAPDEATSVEASEGSKAVAVLEPLVTKFKGLSVDWVVDTMARLADAYGVAQQPEKAQALYAEMSTLYPNNRYQVKAQAGLARAALQTGQTGEALRLLEPLVTKANQSLTSTSADSHYYAEAFLVQGKALEASGKLAEALESYFTVSTVFYHDDKFLKEAETAADQLRQKNPTLSVN